MRTGAHCSFAPAYHHYLIYSSDIESGQTTGKLVVLTHHYKEATGSI